MSSLTPWIAVDLDGTLAVYDHWQGPDHIGEPIALMVERVKAWRAEGKEVRIFTARISPHVLTPGKPMPVVDTPEGQEAFRVACAIAKWSEEHLGEVLGITCQKDYGMVELWDDRCVQVIANTGIRADGQP